MTDRILPFLVTQSKEKLTDRGHLALLDEFITSVGLTDKLDQVFPSPGSGRGIKAKDYVRSLIYHFADGGRHLEEIKSLKNDQGFRSLIKMKQMPGPDAMGNWLRRLGNQGGEEYVQETNDSLVRRYVKVSDQNEFVFDVDATLIESHKGDAAYSYKKERAYHPMTGWLSDGRRKPICSYVEFRQGNASPQTNLLEAFQHTERLIPKNKRIKYFRSDSAAYQVKIIDYCNDNDSYYTITADKDASVMSAIMNIPRAAWKPLRDQKDGFTTGREVAETIHTMKDSNHVFRLVVQRELNQKPDLFGPYSYYGIITNIPKKEMTPEQVIWHHRGRGNCERYIEDTKYGLTLRYVPCGQFEANAMYYTIGILTFNLLKLMQMMVLPKSWLNRTVLSLRREFFRFVSKVTYSQRQLSLQVNKTLKEIKELIQVREKMWLLLQSR